MVEDEQRDAARDGLTLPTGRPIARPLGRTPGLGALLWPPIRSIMGP